MQKALGRVSRSWALAKASAGVLVKDKELLVFPLLSIIASLFVIATFALPMLGQALLDLQANGGESSLALYAIVFLFYMVLYFVIFFFNAALVGAAMIRLNGGDPTVMDGLRIATRKAPQILAYAALAATVGMVLRFIQDRGGWLGSIVGGLLGVAWTVASFLVVPLLVSRDIGPLEAVKESALLLKGTWGENLIGQGGVGLVFGLLQFVWLGACTVVGALVLMAGFTALGIMVIVVMVSVSLLLILVQAALSGIYSAALYRHAVGAGATGGFEPALLENAFVVEGER